MIGAITRAVRRKQVGRIEEIANRFEGSLLNMVADFAHDMRRRPIHAERPLQ
jgi:hypothetical protein